MKQAMVLFATIISVTTISCNSFACTDLQLRYQDHIYVGRNFDWTTKYAMLVTNPVGMQRQATIAIDGSKPKHWTSKFASMTFDYIINPKRLMTKAVTGGINTEGLVASILELDATKYPTHSSKPTVNSGLWVQYILDNAKDVPQAISLSKKIAIKADVFYGHNAVLHLMMHDAAGNIAVLEYLNGKLHIINDKTLMKHPVLTNTPYRQAVAKLANYQAFGGEKPLPGSAGSLDRFVRANSFIHNLTNVNSNSKDNKQQPQAKIDSTQRAFAYTFNAITAESEPPGTADPTVWSVVYDLKNRIIYYKDIDNPHIRTVNLAKLNLQKNAKQEYLILNNQLQGNVSDKFKTLTLS